MPWPLRPVDTGGLTMAHTQIVTGSDFQPAYPGVRRIGAADLYDALRKGVDDFAAMPSHVLFLGIVYPLAGIVFGRLALGYDMLPLVFPLIFGFALIGPVAAIGLYELSRRREKGLPATWRHAFSVLRSRSLPSIVALGSLLLAILVAWLVTAQTIYSASFGNLPPESLASFAHDVFNTQAGWNMIVAGGIAGFLFAVLAFAISVVSFPLLLDRDVGFSAAVATSLNAVRTNPATMALWAIIVATLLAIGSLPLLLGLTIVVPVLGHATWHLYRKVVEPGSSRRPSHRTRRRTRRYAADFPAVLFPWTR
jgi:uncharacterized membrane protein